MRLHLRFSLEDISFTMSKVKSLIHFNYTSLGDLRTSVFGISAFNHYQVLASFGLDDSNESFVVPDLILIKYLILHYDPKLFFFIGATLP